METKRETNLPYFPACHVFSQLFTEKKKPYDFMSLRNKSETTGFPQYFLLFEVEYHHSSHFNPFPNMPF